ncbi:hypothetical protein CI102_1288 [Trichoderma harzianum]|nr:hypothetical protein CI102_1288 [Trichoderma harzianum]
MRHVIMFWVEMDAIPDNQPQIAAIRLQDPGPIKIQIGYSECCLRVCCTPRYFAIRFWAHSYASETRTIKTKCVKELSQSALYIMREQAEYRPVSSNVSLSCDPSYRHLRAKQIPRSQGYGVLQDEDENCSQVRGNRHFPCFSAPGTGDCFNQD